MDGKSAAAAEVRITLEKKAGSKTFQRNIQASNGMAAVAGLSILVQETAALLDMTAVEVLAVLAVALTTPADRKEEKGEPR